MYLIAADTSDKDDLYVVDISHTAHIVYIFILQYFSRPWVDFKIMIDVGIVSVRH